MTKPEYVEPKPGEAVVINKTEDITVDRLKDAQAHMKALVNLHKSGGFNIPDEVLAEIEKFAAVPIPSAPALAKAAMLGYIDGEGAMVAWHRARRGIYALAPRLVELAANKLENGRSPGDTRLISKMLEGLGLLNPAEPLTTDQRQKEMTKEKLRGMSNEELQDRLRALAGDDEA